MYYLKGDGHQRQTGQWDWTTWQKKNHNPLVWHQLLRHCEAIRWRWPHWHWWHGHLTGHLGITWGTRGERRGGHASWRGWGHRIIRWARCTHERWGALHTCSRWWPTGLWNSFLHFEVELKEKLWGEKKRKAGETKLLTPFSYVPVSALR